MADEEKLAPAEQIERAREQFEDATDFTVAVEEEFALLDPETLDLTGRFEEVKAAAQGTSLDERRPPGRRLNLLETVREVQRLRIKERELLLDRDREVRRVLELRPRLGDLLLRRQPLLVAHEAHYSS